MMGIEKLYELYCNSAGVTTDSRSLKKGELFFALKGPTHDGNRHAAEAVRAGALAAVVDDHSLTGDKLVHVDNVLDTLTSLAAFHRSRLTIPVIAVTGTNGKTTTKELIRAVLSAKAVVHSTAGNFNNHIGVPLTILSTPPDAGFLITEMGANHPGEIASLCLTAQPTHGIITNIGTAHIEGFGSFENVKAAKAELYRWLGEHNGTAVFNDDDPVISDLVHLAGRAVPYSSPAGKKVQAVPDDEDGMYMHVNAVIGGSRYHFDTSFFGLYNIDNVRAAIAVGLLFNVPSSAIIEAISSYKPANNRSQVVDTGHNIVIRDAYNANPSSMMKALTSFALLHSEKKMVILGDMLELGTESIAGHSSVIKKLSEMGPVEVILIGPLFRQVAGDLHAHLFGSSDEAGEWLKKEKPEGYTIIVKGSRGMMLEKIYPQL